MKRVGLVATCFDRPDLGIPPKEIWVSDSVPPSEREALAREYLLELHKHHHSGDSLLKLSNAIPDPEHVEDPKVQNVLKRALSGFGRLANRIRGDLVAAIKKDRRPEAARKVLAKHMPALTAAMTNTQIAASLAGMNGVAARIPQAVLEAARGMRPVPGAGGPLQPPWEPAVGPGDEGGIHFPIIEEATRDLQERQLLTRRDYDALSDQAKLDAFTVAGVESEAVLGKVRDVLAGDIVAEGGTLKDFAEKVEEAVGPGTFLSPGHQEVVFRNGVQSAYAAGMDKVLANPVVDELFPYIEYQCIHDDRVRPEHKALETLGLDKTAVYRKDDPVAQLFRPPWSWACRCGRNPLTVRAAAAKGVTEAQAWLASGLPPSHPTHVPMPPFSPPPGWTRDTGAMLSLALSGAWEESKHHRGQPGNSGQFGPGGGAGAGDKVSPSGNNTADDGGDCQEEKYKSEHHAAIAQHFGEHLEKSNLSPEKKKSYSAAAASVFDRMPPKAAERFAKNVKAVQFYEDIKALTDAWAATNEHVAAIQAKGGTIGGVYQRSSQALHLDGNNMFTDRVNEDQVYDAAHVYSHEFSHGIDGPNNEISQSNEWQAAWQEEMVDAWKKGAGLSQYSTTQPSEGFAEFGRLLYASDVEQEKIASLFPKSAAIWQSQGLWPDKGAQKKPEPEAADGGWGSI
jgi:hypothetical protein